jgi:hypothetical protein
MGSVSIVAAATHGSGDFFVGILLGGCLGYLVGPALRSWQIYRGWVDASREVRLADQLLDRMVEEDLDELDEQGIFTDADDKAFRATWRTRP